MISSPSGPLDSAPALIDLLRNVDTAELRDLHAETVHVASSKTRRTWSTVVDSVRLAAARELAARDRYLIGASA